MRPPEVRQTVPRKRTRKRKRRIQSVSSSSSSSSSSTFSSDHDLHPPKKELHDSSSSSSPSSSSQSPSSSSSSSSSSSDSDSDESAESPQRSAYIGPGAKVKERHPHRSSSDSPPAPSIPSFIFNPGNSRDAPNEEQVLKEKFRKFWMSSTADAFKEDLEEIRKEPNLGQARLALLIDSLASGAHVFSSSSKDGAINEMEAALGSRN